jgi:hypothetical protein
MARLTFDRTPAVQHQAVYEIKSSLILRPGPAALTDGPRGASENDRAVGNSVLKRAPPKD